MTVARTDYHHRCFWPIGYRWEVLKIPSLGSINMLELHTELRETFYLWGYQFVLKGCNSTARWKRYIGQGIHRAQSFCILSGLTTLPESPCVHQLGSSLNPLLLGLYGGFLTWAWSIINCISTPSPSGVWAWGWSFQASNHGLVFLVTSAHPGALQDPPQSHFIRTEDVPSALIT